MRVALVHNAGSGDSDLGGEDLIGILAKAGYEVDYFAAKRDWKTLIQEPPPLIVVAGGDGTIRKVARAMAVHRVPLAVLPLGTANNIARALGLVDIPIADIVEGWRDGSVHHFDLGSVHGPWGEDLFLESAGAGLLGETMREIDHGDSSYVNDLDGAHVRMDAALEVLERVTRDTPPFHAHVEIDGAASDGEFLLVEAMNFGAAGPNLQLSPQGDTSDGYFDVVILDESHRGVLVELIRARRTGGTAPPLPVQRATRVRCTSGPCTLHVDDRVWHPQEDTAFEAELRRGALPFLMPTLVREAVAVMPVG